MMRTRILLALSFATVCLTAVFGTSSGVVAAEARKTTGKIERLDPALDALVPADAKIEILCENLQWTEGPVWVKDGGFLLFSEIPNNAIRRWDPKTKCQVFLQPSGFTGKVARGGESGSNGLVVDREGRLILCQHGDRRVARLDSSLKDPKPKYVTLADKYEGKRLNSPNDAVVHSSGAIYFTDPPYGLIKGMGDPEKELDFQGVYRISPEGELTLLTKDLERPNGIGLSPDEKTLYVANSHGPRLVIMAYPVKDDGSIGDGKEFFKGDDLAMLYEGSCDGLAVDVQGNVFATVPGGVAVLSPEGKHLGTLLTGKRTANCEFGEDGSTLFMTADDTILRMPTKTKGAGF